MHHCCVMRMGRCVMEAARSTVYGLCLCATPLLFALTPPSLPTICGLCASTSSVLSLRRPCDPCVLSHPPTYPPTSRFQSIALPSYDVEKARFV